MLVTCQGKRVIVAGAARGIGHTIAVAFAENGGEVTACDRLVDEVKSFAGPAKGGGTVLAAEVDVTNKPSIEVSCAPARTTSSNGKAGEPRGKWPSSSALPCAGWEPRKTSWMLSCSWLRIMLPG